MSIGRGAISWIALQTYRQADAANAEDSGREPEDEITLKNAVRAALRNWPVLILSALLYGTLMSLAVAGLVYVLREVRLDLSNYRWLRNEPNAITSAMIVRGINISMPDPGSPFTEIYNYTRFSLSRSTSSVYYGWMNYSQTVGRFSVQLALIGLVSALGILLIDTLLCFRNVAIMNQRRAHALSWIATCTQLSRRHFWSIASARVGLRAIMYLTSLLCLTLPMTIQQSMILPNVVQRVQSYLPYALNGAASNIALALASGIFVVFGLAFDVRLFLALQHPEPIATHPNPPSG
jgi:branched-subunit amino acid transport protein